jgi:hypothetical protein
LFPFGEDMFLSGESSVEVQPSILDLFCLRELDIVDVNRGTRSSLNPLAFIGSEIVSLMHRPRFNPPVRFLIQLLYLEVTVQEKLRSG